MPRTTYAQVAEIIEIDATITTDAAPFIATANALVTRVCADKLDEDGTAYYTDDDLELIERWLAAHFYAIRDPRYASEAAGSVNASYQYKVDLHLAVTTYGQQAMMLDTAGGLAALSKGKRRRVGASYLGTDPPNAYTE